MNLKDIATQAFTDFMNQQPADSVWLVARDADTTPVLKILETAKRVLYTVNQGSCSISAPGLRPVNRRHIAPMLNRRPADIVVTGCKFYSGTGAAWPRRKLTCSFISYLGRKFIIKKNAVVMLVASKLQQNELLQPGDLMFNFNIVLAEDGIISTPLAAGRQPGIAASCDDQCRTIDDLFKSGVFVAEKSVCVVEDELTAPVITRLQSAGCRIYRLVTGRRGITSPNGDWISEEKLASSCFGSSAQCLIVPSREYPIGGRVMSKDPALVDLCSQLRHAGFLKKETYSIAVTSSRPSVQAVVTPFRITEYVAYVSLVVAA